MILVNLRKNTKNAKNRVSKGNRRLSDTKSLKENHQNRQKGVFVRGNKTKSDFSKFKKKHKKCKKSCL